MKSFPPVLVALSVLSGALLTAVAGGGLWLARRSAPRPPDASAARAREIEQEMNARHWERSLQLLDQLEPAFQQRDRAQRELKNRARYLRFLDADRNKDWESAIASHGELDLDSVYAAEAQPRWSAIKVIFIAQHLAVARRALDEQKWETVRREVETVLAVDEHQPEALAIAEKLRAAHVPPPPEQPDDYPPPRCDTTLVQAQTAYVRGQYQPAIAQARQCTATEPMRAWRVIGAASCFMSDRAQAMEAYDHVEPQGKQFLKYVCARKGITLR